MFMDYKISLITINMAYRPIQARGGNRKSQALTLMAPKGENLRDLPQLLDTNYAQRIRNLLIDASGQMYKRGGLEKIIDTAGTEAITMIVKFDADDWIFAYGTTVSRYNFTTETVTVLKNDFVLSSDGPGISGVRYGEYVFVVSGAGKVWRMDNTFAFTEVAASPSNSRCITVAGNRIAVGDHLGTVTYSEVDDGTDPPFNTWTTGTVATAAGTAQYRNGGAINSLVTLGNNIVVFSENGKFAFYIDQIDLGGTISKIEREVIARTDYGGFRGAIQTKKGLYYVNEAGLWNLAALGQPGIDNTDQEAKVTLLLGGQYFDGKDLSGATLAFDPAKNTVYVSLRNGSDVNNYMLAYNTDTQAVSEITGWNIGTFMTVGDTIYGGSSVATKIYECFTGHDDDGSEIGIEYIQELTVGTPYTKKSLDGIYVQGFLSESQTVNVKLDIYDVQGRPINNKLVLEWSSQYNNNTQAGYNGADYSGASYNGDYDLAGMIESFDGATDKIRNFQRVRLHITNSDKLPLVLNWVSLLTTEKARIRRRKLTNVT